VISPLFWPLSLTGCTVLGQHDARYCRTAADWPFKVTPPTPSSPETEQPDRTDVSSRYIS
jgi:hypothetical protein